MKKTVMEIVGTNAICEEEIGGLTVCDEVYKSAITRVSFGDEIKVRDCTKRMTGLQTPSRRSAMIGEKKANELMVKLGIFLAGQKECEFLGMLREWRLRRARGY